MTHGKTIRTILLSAVCFSLLLYCSEAVTSPEDLIFQRGFDDVGEIIERAYRNDSQTALDSAFTLWRKIIPPYSTIQRNAFSDTVKNVYDIFETFYQPETISNLTQCEEDDLWTDLRYIVIQNYLRYFIVDTSVEYYSRHSVVVEETIDDFRPEPPGLTLPLVYLSLPADSMIRNFLYEPDDERKLDHSDRVSFLCNAMQLTQHHWFNMYHKATMPNILEIRMNEQFTEALVSFRVFYKFGVAYLTRRDYGWGLVYARIMAIE